MKCAVTVSMTNFIPEDVATWSLKPASYPSPLAYDVSLP